jgi:hypothetical protein
VGPATVQIKWQPRVDVARFRLLATALLDPPAGARRENSEPIATSSSEEGPVPSIAADLHDIPTTPHDRKR